MKVSIVLLIPHLTIALRSATDHHHEHQVLRRNTACPDGYGGTNCKVGIDECASSPYPCTGGNKVGSFCVDYDPPQKYKCGCLPGYDAVLPSASAIMDNVPVDWRPLKCIPRDVCVGFVCHEDARCIISSNNTAVCICIDDLVGDGITTCAPPPKQIVKKPTSPPSTVCQSDADCAKLENSVCVTGGSCECKVGFYRSSGKGQCLRENQCADGYPNDCHKNAICSQTEDGYTCACKDGYYDLRSTDKPGTVCAQKNECLDSTMNDCNDETEICLDLPPPLKWQCVERTPSPTPVPTPASFLCVNNNEGESLSKEIVPDLGCSESKPHCVADPGKGGFECRFCINDQTGAGRDTGCTIPGPAFCKADEGKGGDKCGSCINNAIGDGADSGCLPSLSGGNTYCDADPEKVGDVCGTCINTDIDTTGRHLGCTKDQLEKYCDADPGKVGTSCGICINNAIGDVRDTGCPGSYDGTYCDADPGKVGDRCGYCINDQAGVANTDIGCSSSARLCNAKQGQVGFECTLYCVDDNDQSVLPVIPDTGCNPQVPKCVSNVCGNF